MVSLAQGQSIQSQTPVWGKIDFIGVSDAIQQIWGLISRVAKTDITILITGESGTGKEMVAQAIHANSHRAENPFIRMNCAAVPETLLESELFGHKRGAFTGAVTDRNGKFLLSDKGTLFLDEVGDLSSSAQAKILRTIESGEVEMVGGERLEKVNARIISATNQNLEDLIERGLFREDLYHRINVLEINIPPLRERPEDIVPLADHFLNLYCRENDLTPKVLAPSAVAVLIAYHWPGNVRELKNVMQKVAVLVDSAVVGSGHIHGILGFDPSVDELNTARTYRKAIKIFEKNFLIFSLLENDWNISKTAVVLGLPRSCLYDKLNKYGIKKCLGGRTQLAG